MNNTEEKRQHLDFIQNTIVRMSTNSFQIKALSVAVVTAVLALYGSSEKEIFILVSIPPTIVFWFLDSYYLQQERKFRGVYNDVAGLTEINQVKLYEMPIYKYNDNKFSFWNVLFSKTIRLFYISIIVLLLLIYFILISTEGAFTSLYIA